MGGKFKRYYVYNVCDHAECYREVHSQAISYTTGGAAMLGAKLLLEGKWKKPGVWNVEQLDPDPFMTEIGRQRKKNKYTFPLIGVVFDTLLMKEEPASILDSNHTHFLLIPGDDWGDESSWLSKMATVIAGENKSLTVLVNGGRISRSDVEYSLLEKRPTFVMRGTGRLADEITLTGNVIPIDISHKPEEILEILKTKL